MNEILTMLVTLNMNKSMTLPMYKFYEHTPGFLEFIERHVNIRDGKTHS
jgi:hypothetical protein